jgi:hypothetical protein
MTLMARVFEQRRVCAVKRIPRSIAWRLWLGPVLPKVTLVGTALSAQLRHTQLHGIARLTWTTSTLSPPPSAPFLGSADKHRHCE